MRSANADNAFVIKHKLLNTYVHQYRDKLCLGNQELSVTTKDPNQHITIDYDELLELQQATEEAGYNPYEQYMKNKTDLKRRKLLQVRSFYNRQMPNQN